MTMRPYHLRTFRGCRYRDGSSTRWRLPRSENERAYQTLNAGTRYDHEDCTVLDRLPYRPSLDQRITLVQRCDIATNSASIPSLLSKTTSTYLSHPDSRFDRRLYLHIRHNSVRMACVYRASEPGTISSRGMVALYKR